MPPSKIEKEPLNLDHLSNKDEVVASAISPATTTEKSLNNQEESANLENLISMPSIEEIQKESSDLIEMRKQNKSDELINRYERAITIYKRHLVARIVDCVPKKDKINATKWDETKWNNYMRLWALPPEVVGSVTHQWKLKLEFERLLKEDGDRILQIKKEAVAEGVKLPK